MKNSKFLIIALFTCTLLKGQPPLYILTDKMYDSKLVDSQVANGFIKEKAVELFNELGLNTLYTPIVINNKSYEAADHFIKMYSCYNYLNANEKESIIPKYIVHKRNWQTPYYYSYFIGRKSPSYFNSLNDFYSIKRIYLRNNSMSGYYSALYKFWELGFIKNPSVKSLREQLHKEVVVFNTNEEVINAVNQDPYSIGASGEENFGNSNVEIKLVNMVLPQDVICISQNSIAVEEKLNSLIIKLFSDSALRSKVPLYISNIKPFSQPYINSYKLSESIIKVVNQTKDSYDKEVYLSKVVPLNDKITFSDLLDFIGKSSLSVYLWVLGILLAFYTLGHNTGKAFLPLLAKAKNQIKSLFTFNG